DYPRDQEHDDGQEIIEEAGEAHQLADLAEQWPGGLEPSSGEPAGLEQVIGGQAVGGGFEPETGEGAVDDVGERAEVVQDEGEGADVEHLLDEAAKDVGLA